jgi:osmotically-inducible protein OsmY
MSDKQLRQDVLDELDYDPSLCATHIGVAVEDGVVTLTGHVASYAEKLAAERAVRRVGGVRALAQEIEIRLPGGSKVSDDEIARRAAHILHWDTRVPDEQIQITVHNGHVTLAGEVEWQYQRLATVTDVHKLSGVVSVDNQITLKPHAEALDVQKRIVQALRRSAEIEAQHIQVTVQEGTVVLEGNVHDIGEREAVEQAVWSAPGVRKVEDHLTIGQ